MRTAKQLVVIQFLTLRVILTIGCIHVVLDRNDTLLCKREWFSINKLFF